MITDRLYSGARKHAERVFLVFEGREFTYSETARLTGAMAARLCTLGVRGGDRVALLCENRPAFLIAWFAIAELGAVAVPLNTALFGDSLRYILRQSNAAALLATPALAAARAADIADTPVAGTVVVLHDEEVESSPPAHFGAPVRLRSVPEAAPSSILYTSGTTGLPKGAVIPHGAYDRAGMDMARSLALTPNDRVMVFLPLFHANPLMYALTSVLTVGATLILLPRFSASTFLFEAVRHRATGFTYVGTVLAILDKHYPGPQRQHDLRWCVGGGAPRRVWESLQANFGFTVNELYGMTETGGWVSMNTREAMRLGSVGRARDGVTLSIRDEQGRVLAHREKGEIVAQARPPWLFFDGYWDNADATALTLREGCVYTGDRGWLDKDGYLYFEGRLKELIRQGGEMVSPAGIETHLLKHPLVADCAVFGVAHDILGEEIRAAIVCEDAVDADALHAFLAERLPAFMLPRRYVFVTAIPKTETQKIKRHELGALTDKRNNA